VDFKKAYNQNANFLTCSHDHEALIETETPEPMKTKTGNPPSRFVVLFHQLPPGNLRGDHWDLMLEQDGKLLTWSLTEPLEPGKSIAAERLADHRIDYLQYEGSISDDRGSVSRIREGTYSWNPGSEQQIAILTIDKRQWEIRFQPVGETKSLISIREI
jgi:hypothetical protein